MDGTHGSPQNALYPTSTFNLTLLRWSGGDGDDTINAVFTSNGTSNIDLFDDTAGVNLLNIACTDFVCNVLSRENFIANIHNKSDPHSSTERINIDRVMDATEESGWLPSVDIDSTFIQLNGGLNKVYFDGKPTKCCVPHSMRCQYLPVELVYRHFWDNRCGWGAAARW